MSAMTDDSTWFDREDEDRPGTPDGDTEDWYAASDYEGELALWLDMGGEA